VLVLLALAAGLAGCGGGGDAATTLTAPEEIAPPTTTVAERPQEPGALAPGKAKGVGGAVTLCGAEQDVAAAAPAIARFNVERPRLQASTLGFPAGRRTLRELRARVVAVSKECDVVVVPEADVPALAADGGLYDLQPYAEERGETEALDAVRAGVDVFAVRAAFGPRPRPVLGVAAPAGNPGGALALLDVLSGGRTVPPEKP
jgi:ABC-type glycerol-3-phosphate transport system substrate-binding protein